MITLTVARSAPRVLLTAARRALLPGVFVLPALTPGPALAHCWIDRERPTTADQLPVTSPRVAEMRAAAHEVNRILKGNRTLQALPDVRLRSTWQVTGHPARTNDPYALSFVLWAHGPNAWAGACDLIPEADRLEPRAALVVHLNSINSTLTQRASSVRDETLQAFVEPEAVGRVGDRTVYQGQWIVLTFDGRVPWVPVTMAEYLDFEERRLVKAEADTARDIATAQAGAAAGLDEDALGEAYEAMKKVNPADAEKLRAMMEQVRRDTAGAAAAAPPVVNAHTQALADLRALRASLSPEQLRQQARDGYTSIAPPAPVDRLPKLVRIDPAFPWDRSDPNRVRLIEIHYSGRGAPYTGLMEQAAATLDWTAFERLMR